MRASLFLGALLGEPGGIKEGSGHGHLFPWGPRWETWDRTHMPGAYVWKKVLGRVSQHIGALLRNLGEGSYARGLCVEEGSGMGVSPYRGPTGEPGEI